MPHSGSDLTGKSEQTVGQKFQTQKAKECSFLPLRLLLNEFSACEKNYIDNPEDQGLLCVHKDTAIPRALASL